jgi:DNA-binding NtrC family response regulator
MGTEKVLLVDDEVEFVEALAERLRSRGLEVDTAHDGHAGVASVEKHGYDAVVLDFAMPGMNGIDTLKAMLDIKRDLQVMLLTGQATVKAAVEATRLGAVDVLEKPTDIGTLLEKIRLARGKRIAAAEKRSQKEVEEILRTRGW